MQGVKVLFKSSKGVMTFEKRKAIFQHINSKETLEIGLGVIKEGTLVDKGKFAFADMYNVYGFLPEKYFTIDHFENIGVPRKVYKATYGNSVFLKEEYQDRTYITAYDSNCTTLMQEVNRAKNGAFNVYFARLDNLLGDWEDITDIVISRVVDSLLIRNCELNLTNPFVLYALKKLTHNPILQANNGVIYAQGRYETLAVWGWGNKASMAWLGRDISHLVNETNDITEDIDKLIKVSGIA